jgi:hypothetical protein
MTPINAGLACSLGLQEQRDPDPRSASGYWPSHGCVAIEIDGMATEELNELSRPICSACTAEVCMPDCGGTA